jgi:hypothetical protein
VTVQTLPTGAQIRFTGRTDGIVALCVNGGTARELPGTWSPSAELLMRRCTPHLPDVGWAEVRYRVRSWRQLEICIEDGRAALDAAAAAGARGTYTMIPGAIHPIALRAPWGSLIPMPRAEEWARRVGSVVAAAARREPAPGHAS